MLERIGIKSSPTCRCRRMAQTMDLRGADWCAANVEEIVGWLKAEARERRLLFVEAVARMMVRHAIARSRRSGRVIAGGGGGDVGSGA
jgi:hypothetical protein